MPNRFLRVDAKPLVASAEALAHRIEARFPQANLTQLATTVVEVARRAEQKAADIRRPNLAMRLGVGLLIATMVCGLAFIAINLDFRTADKEIRSAAAFTQFLDAALETIALLGGGAFFLVTIESRLKRGRALAAVHELRSLAHIIDMHQLTKSPDHYIAGASRTKYSPEIRYGVFEVRRYLDYCSELLAMVGKIAVLYVESSSDPVVLDAVDQIENLTASLSRKIWQKLSIFNEVASDEGLKNAVLETLRDKHEDAEANSAPAALPDPTAVKGEA